MSKKLIVSMYCLIAIMQSCTTKKDIIYLQNKNDNSSNNIIYYSYDIQPNDILKVTISTSIPEAALPYNRPTSTIGGSVENLRLDGYLVNKDYTIKLPVLGVVSVKNKTTMELEEAIKTKLLSDNHLEKPMVSVRILNSKVTILGEVNAPGTYNFSEASLTLFQALGYAGDLNINGKRDDILVIREENGVRHITSIDLTAPDLLDHPYYAIKQNDIIYVKPNVAKVKSAGYIGNIGTALSVASILISTLVLLAQ